MKYICVNEQEKLRDIINFIEINTRSIIELKDFYPKIKVIENFLDLPNDKDTQNDYAVFRKSANEILINKSNFFYLNKSNKIAVLIHETAHSYIFNNDIKEIIDKYFEEFDADLFACRWSFFEYIKNSERIKNLNNKKRYIECLSKFADRSEILEKCYIQWLAGI